MMDYNLVHQSNTQLCVDNDQTQQHSEEEFYMEAWNIWVTVLIRDEEFDYTVFCTV